VHVDRKVSDSSTEVANMEVSDSSTEVANMEGSRIL
jgi:hypothetical protein